jgi:hypothetical protein
MPRQTGRLTVGRNTTLALTFDFILFICETEDVQGSQKVFRKAVQ